MRSANPALNDKTFGLPGDWASPAERASRMTLQGTVTKTGILLAMVVFAASFTWTSAMKNPEGIYSWVIGGALVGFGLAMVTVFKKAWSPVTGPLYALAEGLLLGGLSAVFERQFPGIVIQAVSLTFGVAFALLLAYTTRLIKPTENFKMGVAAATGGVALVYLTSMVLGLFGVSMPFLHDASPLGIGISIVIVIIAALNLVLDFDFIEQGAEQGAPKYMEWYAAFGLVVTLVWLYLEILRLLSKLQSRN